MPMGHRKTPFSGKKKKEQLKQKREKKVGADIGADTMDPASGSSEPEEEGAHISAKVVAKSSGSSAGSRLVAAAGIGTSDKRRGRYALKFREESKEELELAKVEARNSITSQSEESLEAGSETFFVPGLDFPTRPPWSYEMSTEELEANERKYFEDYLNNISEKFPIQQVSFFELNLETWRQLWRVLELSDILLHIVDIRFPALLFPPKVYEYINEHTSKKIILVLNKIDLAPPGLTVAWKHYFESKFKGLRVALFCSSRSGRTKKRVKKEIINARAAKGALEICRICEELGPDYDFRGWKKELLDSVRANGADFEDLAEENEESEKRGGICTVGCIGQPNVGKSSVINALSGKKVVSVSRTPGHTKHFQTIFLAPGIRICDCPGLIFPSLAPKSLQVLSGSFPISQLREPYNAIKFLGEHLNLPNILGVSHPDGATQWSPMDICEAWAHKRGFYTAKASRPDTYRAANHILRLALEGKICLNMAPPGYFKDKSSWATHEDIRYVTRLTELGDGDSKELKNIDSDSDTAEDTEPSDTEEPVEPKPRPGARRTSIIAMLPNKFAALQEGDED